MTVFLRSECGYTTPIDINVDTTMKDIYDEIGGEPIFSYMGEEIKDLSQSLADLGICPESFIDYKQLKPLAFEYVHYKVIIDPIDKEIHYIPPSPNSYVSLSSNVITKVGHKKYEPKSGMGITLQINDDNLEYEDDIGIVEYDRVSKIPYYPELEKIKDKYPHLFD